MEGALQAADSDHNAQNKPSAIHKMTTVAVDAANILLRIDCDVTKPNGMKKSRPLSGMHPDYL